MDATRLYIKQKHKWSLRRRQGGGGRPPVNLPTTMSNFERQIIYGSMLGDGSTGRIKSKPDSNEWYGEKHSISQEKYIRWKVYNCFKRWMINSDKFNYIETEWKPQLQFRTSSCCIFRILGHNWYKRSTDGEYILKRRGSRWERIKKLPGNIVEVLSSKENRGLGIAVWYMDDGWCDLSRDRVILATESFSREENEILCSQLFKECFEIEGKVRPSTNNKFRIVFSASGSRKFLSIVRPWVEQVPGMEYKLKVMEG